MAGSAPTNSQAVDFEKQQAAEADAKEAKRQADLTAGQKSIDAIFDGSPEMTTTTSNYDWSKFDPTKPPEGYHVVNNNGANNPFAGFPTTQSASAGGANNPFAGFPTTGASNKAATDPFAGFPTTQGAAGGYELQDASGKLYKPGDQITLTSQTPTGKTVGGFGDDFYNAYTKKALDYYQPAEQKQYDEAKRGDLYNFARAGTLSSSAYADQVGQRGYEDSINKANIVANANSQTGQLRDQIQANKASLINQLYATEDPGLAANMAQSSAHASQLQDPTLTPLASLFTPVVAGATGVLTGYQNPYNNPYGAGGGGNTGIAPVSNALGTGSGKTTGGYS